MTTAEQNYRLLQEIEANRRFLLMAYQQNPELLKSAETRIKQMFEATAPREPDGVNPAGMKGQRGISLIELIMFIVIVSVAIAGILLVMNKVTGHSADALILKQEIAIAESMLEEVELQDFIAASAVVLTPVNSANRATGYHIVSSYNGFTTTGVYTPDNVAVAGLGSYDVLVAVANTALGAIPAASAVRITVTVTNNAVPVGDTLRQTVIDGYRTAY